MILKNELHFHNGDKMATNLTLLYHMVAKWHSFAHSALCQRIFSPHMKKGVCRSEISWLFLIHYKHSENQKKIFFHSFSLLSKGMCTLHYGRNRPFEYNPKIFHNIIYISFGQTLKFNYILCGYCYWRINYIFVTATKWRQI